MLFDEEASVGPANANCLIWMEEKKVHLYIEKGSGQPLFLIACTLLDYLLVFMI